MDKTKHYENSIPEDYVLVKHVDAKSDKKQIAIYTLLSFVPLIVILPILFVIAVECSGYNFLDEHNYGNGMIAILVTAATLILYTVLHELTHGITYKCFTGGKLTFGLTLTVAFCGVPNIYVRKKASIAALIMPFVVFTLIFAGLTVGLWFVSPLYGILAGAVFAIHLGGCVGDLHWTLMYVTKFKHCNTLMRDTGPEQWLYIPKSDAEKFDIAPIVLNESKDDNTKAN